MSAARGTIELEVDPRRLGWLLDAMLRPVAVMLGTAEVLPDVEVITHEGADEWLDDEPELEPGDQDPRICHLYPGERGELAGRPLCGAPAGSWGLPVTVVAAESDPCSACGYARCQDCLAA